jgi:general secretion pathway protein G
MRRRAGPRRSQAGFTLIEVIVVLAIIAMLGAVAFTFFPTLTVRVRAALDQDDLEQQLRELPQRVRLSGYGGVLTSQSGDNLPEGTPLPVEGSAKFGAALEPWRVLRIDLPAKWRMRLEKPIFYHFTGVCEGGEVIFALPPVSLRYVLTPPLCRPIRSDEKRPG